MGIIDNNPAKQERVLEGYKIISINSIEKNYDYIIVSAISYDSIIYQIEYEKCIDLNRVIIFFDESYLEKKECLKIFDIQKWRICLLECKVKKLENMLNYRLSNIGYEIIDKYRNNGYNFPIIGDTEEAVFKIVNERCSLVRFGDGEFEIMVGHDRAVFQKYNSKLAERLKTVIRSNDDKLLIAIANNYGNLEQYTDNTADGIRSYMNETVRKFHDEFIYKDKIYYDAYMFKAYLPYKDKSKADKRFGLIKRIWDKRDIVIVEGDKTRTGYGNNLLDNAASIRRILAPTQNAFSVYEKVLNAVLKIEKDELILIALGPAGKVLVYDLTELGYQAVDVGQVDIDYEWYKAGKGTRIPVATNASSGCKRHKIFI